MYKYFLDKTYLRNAQRLCSEIVSDVQDEVRKKGINCQFFLIGSGARNMVTYQERKDGNVYIDFDYNLRILSPTLPKNDNEIKETVRKAFNKIWRKRYGTECVQDSTSSLTSNLIYYEEKPNVYFSIDLGIVFQNKSGEWFRLIHDKRRGVYNWNPVRNSNRINDKVSILKRNHHWDGQDSVRNNYLNIKNKYLRQNDNNHPSFICYIEAINQTFNKWEDW